mgnify:CR=1 FL=1
MIAMQKLLEAWAEGLVALGYIIPWRIVSFIKFRIVKQEQASYSKALLG